MKIYREKDKICNDMEKTWVLAPVLRSVEATLFLKYQPKFADVGSSGFNIVAIGVPAAVAATTSADLTGGEGGSGACGGRRGYARSATTAMSTLRLASQMKTAAAPGTKRQKNMMMALSEKTNSSAKVTKSLELVTKAMERASDTREEREREA